MDGDEETGGWIFERRQRGEIKGRPMMSIGLRTRGFESLVPTI